MHRLADRRRAIGAHVEHDRRRQLLAERRQQRLDRVDHRDDVRAGLLQDREVDVAQPAIEVRRLVLLDAVVDARHFVEAHRIAVAVGDDQRRVRRRPHQLPVGQHGEGAVRPVHRPGRQVDVGALNRGRHFVDADAARRQLARIDVDAHRVLGRAEQLHLRDAADHRDALADRLGVLVDRRERQRRRSQRQEDHRLIAGIDLLVRRRRRHLRRQLPRRPRDHRLHVLRGGVDVRGSERTAA